MSQPKTLQAQAAKRRSENKNKPKKGSKAEVQKTKAQRNRELMIKADKLGGPWPMHPSLVSNAVAAVPTAKPMDAARFKAEQEFELSPARCQSCVNYKPPHRKMVNSIPIHHVPPHCGLSDICVKPYSVCNAWKGRDGSTLE